MQNHKQHGLSIRTVVAIGIGAAIVFLLKRFGSVPTGIPNTNIDTSYGFLAFFASLFGPVAGFIIGFLGHMLNDLTYGTPWWTWVITTGILGGIIGLFWKRFDVEGGNFGTKKIISFNVFQIIANLGCWVLLAPTLDILVYSEPANKVYLQGIVSGISNAVSTGVIGTILLVIYAASRTKRGSLKQE